MKKIALLILAALAIPAFAAKVTLSSDLTSDIRGIDMTEYRFDGASFTPVKNTAPVLKARAPTNAVCNVCAIYPNVVDGVETNINGKVYVPSDVYWYFNFDATGYHPVIRYTYIGSPTFPKWEVAVQIPAQNLGAQELDGKYYDYLWYGRCWIEKGVTPYIQVYVDTNNYDGPEEDLRKAKFLAATRISQPGTKMQYVMVDEFGNVKPSNVLSTIAEMVTIENALIVARESAIAQSNAFVTAQKVTADLTEAINNNAVTIYQHDYVYSLGEAVTVSTNCQCRIYKFAAKQGRYNLDGIDYDASDIYYGFTEDIGSLTPEAKFKDSLGGDTIDWEVIRSDAPELQNHSFEQNGDVYAFCYKMRVYIPHEYNSVFIKVFTEITAQQGDGSTLDIVNGIKDGFTGTVTFGDTTIEFVGGLALAPKKE
jgi:hypothetical protein